MENYISWITIIGAFILVIGDGIANLPISFIGMFMTVLGISCIYLEVQELIKE